MNMTPEDDPDEPEEEWEELGRNALSSEQLQELAAYLLETGQAAT